LPPSEIIAHRGGYGYGPENTVVNFRHGLEHGATAIEMDLRRTADGVIVIMHDETVDRTTNGIGPINGFTLDQVKQLDAGVKWGPGFAGERVPTLEEALLAVKAEGGKACLDLKEASLGQGIREVVSATSFPPQNLLCISYDLDQLDDFVRWLPESRALFIAGGTPRSFAPDVLLVVKNHGGAGHMFWNGPFLKDDIDYGHDLGLEVHYMGGAPENAYPQIELGIDGFGTDWPEACAHQYCIDAWNDWTKTILAHHESDGLVDPTILEDPEVDADGDGTSNLIEYAVGSDPLTADVHDDVLRFATNIRGQPCISFPLRQFRLPHLVVTPLVSSDLENWSALSPLLPAGGATEIDLPAEQVSREFVKLHVRFRQ
jgi:glycerophosphoryl diester phosphodiesterase